MLLWYPLSFQTPGWSIWPSFWISCCTQRGTQTTGTHTMHCQPHSLKAHTQTHTRQRRPCKRIDRTCMKRRRNASEERKGSRREKKEGAGAGGWGVGRGESIIMCHSIWSWAKTHAVNNLGRFFCWAGCCSIKNIMPNMSQCLACLMMTAQGMDN